MRVPDPRTVFLLGSVMLVIAPLPSEACTCVRQDHACESAWTSGAVFLGEVLDVSEPDTRGLFLARSVRVRVLETIAGEPRREVTVVTLAHSSSCGFQFALGGTYLIYGETSDTWSLLMPGEVGVSTCSRTRPIESAAEDLAYLRATTNASPSRGAILGKVVRQDPRSIEDPPFAGLLVTAEAEGVRHQAVSGLDGRYRIDVAPGTYEITFELPPGLWVDELLGPVSLRDARGCVAVDAFVRDDGRVTGRVVDVRGDPVPGLTVKALPESGMDSGSNGAVTADDGTYEIRRLAADTYRIAVVTLGRSYSDEVLAFHPGTSTREAVTSIRVDRGGTVTLPDLVLPGSLAFGFVEGVVRDHEGRPVAGAVVNLEESSPDGLERTVGSSGKTGGDGRFRIAAPPGRSYRVAGAMLGRYVIGTHVPGGGWHFSPPSHVFELHAGGVVSIDLELERPEPDR